MVTQAPIQIGADVWTDVSGGMTNGLRYLVTNEGNRVIKIFEGSTPPTDGDTAPGHSMSGRGNEMFVTKEAGEQFYCYSRSEPSVVMVSQGA